MRDRARILRASWNSLAIALGFTSVICWHTRDRRWQFGHRMTGRRHYLDVGAIVVSWVR